MKEMIQFYNYEQFHFERPLPYSDLTTYYFVESRQRFCVLFFVHNNNYTVAFAFLYVLKANKRTSTVNDNRALRVILMINKFRYIATHLFL